MQVPFNRLLRLTGGTGFGKIKSSSVIIFGVGGVGSWCAEALIRSGISELTIVDSDLVCRTNINRQIQATTSSIGESKVVALKNRLLDINPSAKIIDINMVYSRSTADRFDLSKYDYTLDAIDSLSNKVDLIEQACKSDTILFSSLGASSRLDPTRIKIDSIWNSHGCKLGRFVRKRLRKRNLPKDFKCVYSDETLPVLSVDIGCGTGKCACPKIKDSDGNVISHEWCSSKKQINGSIVHITAIFGFYLSSLVINSILEGREG